MENELSVTVFPVFRRRRAGELSAAPRRRISRQILMFRDDALRETIAGVSRELRRRRWIGVAFIALGLIFLADIVGPEFFGPGQTKDFSLWYQTGRAVLEGRPIYGAFQDQHVYFLYPPFAAILLALPAALGRIGDYAALGILNWLAWMVAAVAGLALSGGPTHRLTLVIPSLALLTLIAETFAIGQPNLILLAIVLSGFVAIEAKREILGGSLIALATSIKAFPATLLVYLVIRGNYRAAAAMGIATLVFTFAVPVAVRGPTLAIDEISTWSKNMLTADASDLAQRGERNWGFRNQSLLAQVHRLTRNVEKMPDESPADEPHINVVDLGFRGANFVFVALSATLGAGFLWLRSRWELSDARVRAYDLTIALSGVVLISPLARNYFFVWLLFPVTVLAGDLRDANGRFRLGPVLGLCIAVVAIWFGEAARPRLLAVCGPTLAALLIIAALCAYQASRRTRFCRSGR
jgi:hypothetical protein